MDVETAEYLEQLSGVLTSTTTSIYTSSFVLNVLLAGSLNSLWSLIESQQLVIIMPMFNLIIPAQAAVFFNVLMQVAAFDPIPAEKTIDIWLNLEATGAYKPKFGILGFESMFCVSNMGTQAIIIFSVFLILLVSKIL